MMAEETRPDLYKGPISTPDGFVRWVASCCPKAGARVTIPAGDYWFTMDMEAGNIWVHFYRKLTPDEVLQVIKAGHELMKEMVFTKVRHG